LRLATISRKWLNFRACDEVPFISVLGRLEGQQSERRWSADEVLADEARRCVTHVTNVSRISTRVP
jgi:hypothetical protein